MSKSLSNKYSQKYLDSAKKSTIHAIKTASKRAIQKQQKQLAVLIGNEIADKTTNLWKKSSRELYSQNNKANDETEIPKEWYTSPAKRQQIIGELKSS